MFLKGQSRSETAPTDATPSRLPDHVIMGVLLKFFDCLKSKAALIASIFIDVTFRYRNLLPLGMDFSEMNLK